MLKGTCPASAKLWAQLRGRQGCSAYIDCVMQEEQQKRRSRKREKRKKKGAKPGDEGSDEEDAFDSGDALSESAGNPQPVPAPEPSQPLSKPEPVDKAAVAAAEKEAAAPRPAPLKEDTNWQRPHTAKQNGTASMKVPPATPPPPGQACGHEKTSVDLYAGHCH